MGTILDKIYDKEDEEIQRVKQAATMKYSEIRYKAKCFVCEKEILLSIQYWGQVTILNVPELLCHNCSINLT